MYNPGSESYGVCPYDSGKCGLCRYANGDFPGTNPDLFSTYIRCRDQLKEVFSEHQYVKFSGCVLKLKHGEENILVSANFEEPDNNDITLESFGNRSTRSFRDHIHDALPRVRGFIRTVSDEQTFIVFKDKETELECVRHKVQLLLIFNMDS